VVELNIGHFLMGEALFVGLSAGHRRDAPRDGCRTRLTAFIAASCRPIALVAGIGEGRAAFSEPDPEEAYATGIKDRGLVRDVGRPV
jgi:hypothetical protein